LSQLKRPRHRHTIECGELGGHSGLLATVRCYWLRR
jgi:hypothetical protein